MQSLNLIKVIITCALYISLARATNIGLFYPSNEVFLSRIDYTVQTLTNFILLILLAGYVFLLNNYSFITKFIRSPLIVTLMVGALLSVILSTDPVESLKFTIAVCVVSFPVLIYAIHNGTHNLMRQICFFIMGMCALNLFYILVMPHYGIMSGNHAGRWRGLFEHKNIFGPFFAISFFVLLHYIRSFSPPFNYFAIISLLISFVFVIKAGSASALVCFALFAIIYPVFLISFHMRPMERLTIYLGTLSLGIITLALLGPFLSDILFALTGRDATLTGRTGIWQVLMAAVWESPLIGYGSGMAMRPEFMRNFQEDIGWGATSAHNSYIDLMLNYGLLFATFIIYLITRVLGRTLFQTFKHKSELQTKALGSAFMFIVLVVSFATSAALVSRTIFWTFMIIGMILILMPANKPRVPSIKRQPS